jgi:molybdate transport system ATP-binding protein
MIEIDIAKRLHGGNGHLDVRFKALIKDGELVTIYGPSGAGKTSVLRMLAGLMTPDEGRIVVDGLTWFDKEKRINLKTQVRHIGMVFQDYSLFPNMTVLENLEFALSKGQSKQIIDELLSATELEEYIQRKPAFLSGGQQQRVALARALVRRPRVLLLDEPLSALDMDMQFKLQDYMLKIHRQYGLTTVLVSHDMIEVARLSNRVLILENGSIRQEGPPSSVLPLDKLPRWT